MPHMSPACSGRMQQARRVVSREIACRPQSAACAAASVAAVAAHGCKQSGCRSASTRGGPPRHRCPLGSGRAAAWHHCDSAKAEPELAHRRGGDSFRRRAASQLPAAASSCGQRALSQKPVPASQTGPRAHQLYGDATRGALLAERCHRWPSRSRCGRRPHRRSASECGECGARRSGAPAVNSKRGGRGALVTQYPRSTYRRLRSAAHRRSRERATSGSARTSTGASRRAPSLALL